ncbi:hypothetical protein DFQ28_005802 [Apophysomyces sp. BC1034]|nr:hypothetical protein DFQ30_005752 [Apophysomyces sp. BC1015]KAG0177521.1 hypothetical protein DFQ29_004751 [Apophysomyces sp. BC1021]KAG0187818.1 hypothetical protein DFQ28_005802 [Apophysomyces sp. BC1034]
MYTFHKLRFGRVIPIALLALFLICTFAFQYNAQLHSLLRPNGSSEDTDALRRMIEEEQRIQKENNSRNDEIQKTQQEQLNKYRTVFEPVLSAADQDMTLLQKSHDIAIPTPIHPWRETDMDFFKTSIGQSLLSELLLVPEDVPSFKDLTFWQRIFKALFLYLDPIVGQGIDVSAHPEYKEIWTLYNRLETAIYPWLHKRWKNAFQINKGSSGRGIVICIGNHQFQYAATTIRSIREVLGSDLPIEAFYIRDNDLTESRRTYLETEFSNVRTIKLVDYIDDDYTKFGGWSIKPYAMLASSFDEVILMDADVYFFQKPETLYDNAGYQRTGSLFFYDRTLFPGWNVGMRWLQSFLPTYSSLMENTRWWRLISAHEQESGVVVIHKKKSLLGLLASCKMNDQQERDQVTYKHVHGDKETFWIGYEMVQTPYAFVKSYGAVIGGLGDAGASNNVCGNQLHLDVNNKPWWWNGGLVRDKYKMPDRYLTFTHYAEGEDWDFDTSCVKDTDKIHRFTSKEHQLALSYVELDKQRQKDESMINDGTWKPKQA